ncbi:MAG TPA: hypothetical protein VGD08_16555, partial [Stellaceae bacterium]
PEAGGFATTESDADVLSGRESSKLRKSLKKNTLTRRALSTREGRKGMIARLRRAETLTLRPLRTLRGLRVKA